MPQAPGLGWIDQNLNNNEFDQQANISINVIPEPATWSLFALGGLGALGLQRLRARRRS